VSNSTEKVCLFPSPVTALLKSKAMSFPLSVSDKLTFILPFESLAVTLFMFLKPTVILYEGEYYFEDKFVKTILIFT